MEHPLDQTSDERTKTYEQRMQSQWAAAWQNTRKETEALIDRIKTSVKLSPMDLDDYASDARKLIADMYIFTREGTPNPRHISTSPSTEWLRTRELASELSAAVDRAWQFDKAS
jgi:hypothetical protein